MKVFVLGHTGMLGNCVASFLRTQGCEIFTTSYFWDSEEFKQAVKDFAGEVIVNCVASLPVRNSTDESIIHTNYQLPLWLVEHTRARLIFPSTDGEFSGQQSPESFYKVDAETDASDTYGLYKAKLSNEVQHFDKVRVIRTSIVGIEENTTNSLLSWFLNLKNGSEIKGFDNVLWNGITTLHWAKTAYRLINDWGCVEINALKKNRNIVQIGSEKTSKYELLNKFNSVFNKQITIQKSQSENPSNRCLFPENITPSIEDQLTELKLFYEL